MNISATSSSLSSLTSLSSLSSTSAVSATDSTSSTNSTNSVSGGSDETKLSKMGQLFSKLQDLEGSDPAKAKEVLTSISNSLSAKASQSGGTDAHLQELADKFKEAASTGDLSGLKPPSGGHGGHGGHHGPRTEGGGPPPPPPSSSSDSSSSSSTSTSSSTSASSQAASYRQNSDNPFGQIESIISNALSGASVTA